MTQYRWIRRTALAGALMLPVFMAGCGWLSQETSKEIDPPPAESGNTQQDGQIDGNAGEQAQGADDGQAAATQGDQTQLTVYLRDGNGYLTPVTLNTALEQEAQAGQRALEMMVEGGRYANLLPEDFTPVLPQGTEVLGYNLVKDQQLAIVDFSKPFTEYNAEDERKIVEAVTWTLTSLPDVKQVEIRYEGEKLNEMPVDGFPLDEPLTRAIGINLEWDDGVDYTRSTPVTLYFSSQTADAEQYFVPVTRLINRTDDTAKAALEQLIAGPLDGSDLIGVMTPDVQVNRLESKDGMVTVDLLELGYDESQKPPAEMLEAVVLSLAENTGADKVQIMLNGKTGITDTKGMSYSEPVSKPEHVNALES